MTRVVNRTALMIVPASVAAALLVSLAFGRHDVIPLPVILDAAVQGIVAALFAAGLLLVHRANRIITFAHGGIAVASSVVLFTLTGEHWSWWVAAPTTVAAAALLGVAIEVLVLRRFATSPRLVATVATIATGQLVVGLVFLLPQWRFGVNVVGGEQADLQRLPTEQVHFPISFEHDSLPIVFTQDHIVAVILAGAALAGLVVFLRRSLAGTAIRAAAENGPRAALLGVGTGALGTLVWAIAGGLAGLGSVLSEPLHNGTLTSLGVGVGAAVLLRGLAAAVLARMEDVPTAIAAAIGISIFERAVFWATGRTAVSDVVLLLLVGASLLLQRGRLSRTEESAASSWAAADEIRPIPAILASLPSVRTGRRWAIGLGAVLVLGYPWAMSPSQVYLGSTYAIYGMVGVSLVVLTGWGGQISLGQFGLVAVGAAVSGALTGGAHVPFPIALLVGSAAGGAVAILLGLPALRIRGLYLAVTTLGFAVAMSTFVLDRDRFGFLVQAELGRPKLAFLSFEDERAYYHLCLGGLLVAVLIATALRRTRTGRVLIAMRDNERAAQSFGISLVRTRLSTFAVSGFIAAMAGVLLAHQQHAVRPEAFGPEQSIQMFLMAIIGGLGSVSGVLAGALYLGSATIFLKGGLGQLLASGAGVLIVLLAYPSGLGGLAYAVRDGWLRRIALRERIYVRSLLGDVRDLDSERSRAPLADRPLGDYLYEIESDIQAAGASQRGKGWVYR
jgi:branched-chain amino acid transport system permease protein